ncbi:hypothetical protein F8M41_025421 [Gigaspora margarita]|uniref:Uncharacterized protein n=1 Tax=Gigaspora margarita TaxID=4874 RepID=A0A8H3XMC2_GIGMA|nr:hypothetical protein F8M41_025421 [Gigaspora margarita]
MSYAQSEPLMRFWGVSIVEALSLLDNERNLSMVDNLLTLLLENEDENFGGTYIDTKENLVYVNTIDFSKIVINLRHEDRGHKEDFLYAIRNYNMIYEYADSPSTSSENAIRVDKCDISKDLRM